MVADPDLRSAIGATIWSFSWIDAGAFGVWNLHGCVDFPITRERGKTCGPVRAFLRLSQ